MYHPAGADGHDARRQPKARLARHDDAFPAHSRVYRHPGGDDVEPVQSQVTVTLEDCDGKTKLTMRMLFPTAAERDRVAEKYGAIEGARQTLERLAEHLARMG